MLLIPFIKVSYMILDSDDANKTEPFNRSFNHVEFLKLVIQTADTALY